MSDVMTDREMRDRSKVLARRLSPEEREPLRSLRVAPRDMSSPAERRRIHRLMQLELVLVGVNKRVVLTTLGVMALTQETKTAA